MKKKLLLLFAVIALASTSCKSSPAKSNRHLHQAGGSVESINLREPTIKELDTPAKTLYLKIDRMARDITNNAQNDAVNKRLLVSTFVDLDRLYRTNTFGRYVAERLMQSLSVRGFTVIESRAAKELMVQSNIGEMALTRSADEMMNKYQADAIVLGTYKKLGDTVTVSARMVVAKNQKVISVASMLLEMDKNDGFMQSMFENEIGRISLQSDVEGY